MAIDYLDKQLSFLTDWFFQCEIFGETASKANSRKIVKFGNRPASIKSDKARAYEKTFASQCVTLDELVEDDVLMQNLLRISSS